MATKIDLYFYEKPGCINNTKQKKILTEKGYDLVLGNILTEEWTRDELVKFFKDRPVQECINRSAPRVKSGEVSVEEFNSYEEAADAMLKDPYLIKRPLLKYGDRYGCGFDSKLATDLINGMNVDSLLVCPQMAKGQSCDD